MSLLLERVIDGFAGIEKQDLRVGRVDVPRNVYASILQDVSHNTQTPIPWPCADWTESTTGRVGTLLGAELNVTGNRIIVYPEGWYDGVRWEGNPVRTRADGLHEIVSRTTVPLVISMLGIHKMNAMTGLGLLINVKSHCRPMWPYGASEAVAIETLRESVTENEWRRYMRNGFLCVRGKSGRVYQILAHGHHIAVWESGTKIAEICSYIKDVAVPATDKVIAFKTMVECDEEELWRRGNVYHMA